MRFAHRGFGRLEKRVLEDINSEHPDLIVVIGDCFTPGPITRQPTNCFPSSKPAGCLLVRGNWENWNPVADEPAFYGSAGVRLLVNSNGAPRADLSIVGFDDPWTGQPSLELAEKNLPEKTYGSPFFTRPFTSTRSLEIPLMSRWPYTRGQLKFPIIVLYGCPVVAAATSRAGMKETDLNSTSAAVSEHRSFHSFSLPTRNTRHHVELSGRSSGGPGIQSIFSGRPAVRPCRARRSKRMSAGSGARWSTPLKAGAVGWEFRNFGTSSSANSCVSAVEVACVRRVAPTASAGGLVSRGMSFLSAGRWPQASSADHAQPPAPICRACDNAYLTATCFAASLTFVDQEQGVGAVLGGILDRLPFACASCPSRHPLLARRALGNQAMSAARHPRRHFRRRLRTL